MYLMALFSRVKDLTCHSATIRPWKEEEAFPLCAVSKLSRFSSLSWELLAFFSLGSGLKKKAMTCLYSTGANCCMVTEPRQGDLLSCQRLNMHLLLRFIEGKKQFRFEQKRFKTQSLTVVQVRLRSTFASAICHSLTG